MISHITLGVADLSAAKKFYDPILAVLGLIPKFATEQWCGWKHPETDRPLFIVTLPFDGGSAISGNGHMIAFLAQSRSDVDRSYSLAIANGGTCEGKPGLRTQYHPDYYGAYFRDIDGNKVCICCHRAE